MNFLTIVLVLMLCLWFGCKEETKTPVSVDKVLSQTDSTDSSQVFFYKTEIFTHILELRHNNDSIFGVYTGAEWVPQTGIVYYQSKFRVEKGADPDSLNFKLDHFVYSVRQFKYIKDDSELLTDPLKFPINHIQPIKFNGKIYGDFIATTRRYLVWDNNADYPVFLRQGYEHRKRPTILK